MKTIDAQGQEATSTYFGDGLKASETDRRGIETTYTYDNVGRPRTTRLDAAPLSGVAWSQETRYIAGLQQRRIQIDARGHETTVDLDALGRVVKETDALGHYRTFAFDGVNKIEETDKRPAHYKTVFEYDGLNRLKKTTDPLLKSVTVQYEDALNRVTETDRRGFRKVTQADPLGRALSVTLAAGTADEAILERNTYDQVGNKVTATDAEGKETRFAYDAANRLASRTDGFGTPQAGTTTYVYDKAGNLLEERDARAAANGEAWSVKKTYDELNRTLTQTDGENHTTTFGYDENGNRTSQVTPKGETESYLYDELGKLTRVTQPAVAAGTPVTSYVYDEARNKIRQTDALGHETSYEYDSLNRLTKSLQDPSGLNLITEVKQFDANSNPEIVVDPKGQTISSTFDELNRLKSKSYAFAASDPVRPWRHTTEVSYTYDDNSNLLRQAEAVASGTDPPSATLVTERTYDGLNRLTSEKQPLTEGALPTATVAYAYYDNGLRQKVTDAAGRVTRYTYDGKSRLGSVTTDFDTASAQTTTYGYWPDDLLHTVTYANGVAATHTYDKADRLEGLTNTKAAATVSAFAYSYDANGNRVSQVETNGGVTETTAYSFDALDRLASITYPVDASYPQGRVVSYGYDIVGNRTRETDKDQAGVLLADKQGVFDNVNRLTTLSDLVVPENSTAFTWDANGNTRTKTQDGVATAYAYDVRDKLTEVTQGTSTLGRYAYDAEGRRRLKIGEDGFRQYVYDQTSLFAEYDEVGSEKARYHYGSDRLVSLFRADEGTRYFSLDGLRSVVNLTSDTGATVASLHLDTWGNYRFPAELDASRNRFGFTGHIWDAETGLYNAKARYYDPVLGRFLTQDSYVGQIDDPPSLHRYFYARNRPTTRVDPTGRYDEDVHLTLTQYLAEKAGFSKDQALVIGEENQKVDIGSRDAMNPTAGLPYNPKAFKYHFVSEEGLRQFKKAALAQGSLDSEAGRKAIGEYLHALEDSYGHQAGRDQRVFEAVYKDRKVFAHGEHGHLPDQTWRRPELAMQMAEDVYRQLVVLREAMGIKGDAVEWDAVRERVQKFVEYNPGKDGQLYVENMGNGTAKALEVASYDKKVSVLDPAYVASDTRGSVSLEMQRWRNSKRPKTFYLEREVFGRYREVSDTDPGQIRKLEKGADELAQRDQATVERILSEKTQAIDQQLMERGCPPTGCLLPE